MYAPGTPDHEKEGDFVNMDELGSVPARSTALLWIPIGYFGGAKPFRVQRESAQYQYNSWDPEDRASVRYSKRRLEKGLPVDPIKVFLDGPGGIIGQVDGGHRLVAATLVGLRMIPAIVWWDSDHPPTIRDVKSGGSS